MPCPATDAQRPALPRGAILLTVVLIAAACSEPKAGAGRAAADAADAPAASPPLSEATQACLACHEDLMPGLVHDWRTSLHAQVTTAEALKKAPDARRVSSSEVPEALREVAVGCFECHGHDNEGHADAFDHQGYRIHVVVTPEDCRTCHATEVEEFAGTKKAMALANFRKNPLYMGLVDSATSVKAVRDGRVVHGRSSLAAKADACFGCHGTPLEVTGTKTVSTDLGDAEVPVIAGWPNHGVGRLNPDGSRGACSACHARHAFSVEVARKPHTCSQCHLQPDVPAWDVWRESKHGNLALSQLASYDWTAVPWIAGRHYRTPTCAVCHNARVTRPDGAVLAERTHDFGARLWVRIFGLPYAVAQPKEGLTAAIRNADGQPLPVTLRGGPAAAFLIDEAEQARRRASMTAVCSACHATSYAQAQFARLDVAVAETNQMTRAATDLLLRGRERTRLADAKSPWDDLFELQWAEQWLFYANSTRYGSAMMGPDYAAFKNGWWELTTHLKKLEHELHTAEAAGARSAARPKREDR